MQVSNKAGHLETLIIDASAGEVVKSFAQVIASSLQNPNGIEALYYTNPNRVYASLTK
jgi:hypothetical protein